MATEFNKDEKFAIKKALELYAAELKKVSEKALHLTESENKDLNKLANVIDNLRSTTFL